MRCIRFVWTLPPNRVIARGAAHLSRTARLTRLDHDVNPPRRYCPAVSEAAPFDLLRTGRRVTGMSAVLLPYGDDGRPDWDAFVAHVARTADAGLVPAVDMDTGFVNLLDERDYADALRLTARTLGG